MLIKMLACLELFLIVLLPMQFMYVRRIGRARDKMNRCLRLTESNIFMIFSTGGICRYLFTQDMTWKRSTISMKKDNETCENMWYFTLVRVHLRRHCTSTTSAIIVLNEQVFIKRGTHMHGTAAAKWPT